jgi:isopentenyl-diphosphate delta-isomerase
MQEEVVLVNEKDEELGTMEKLEAHQKGALHRAFSIFIFNSKNELLLQKRASSKYHSGGLWTNTCCSHPRPGEDLLTAANRRLQEEMGLSCELTHRFIFIYKAPFSNGLTEHELDHVYTGQTDNLPSINTNEVDEFRYISISELKKNIKDNPQSFTEWFKISIDKVLNHLTN